MQFFRLATTTDIFQPYGEIDTQDSNRPLYYQSISFMPNHSHFSPEELRLNDYEHGRGQVVRRHAFPATNGLALAVVPPPLTLFNASIASIITCRTRAKDVVPLGAKLVTFRVGTEPSQQEDFAVHENMITPRSEFVRLALTNDWKEAQERIIPLPDDTPETFELYQQWLYTTRIPSDHLGSDPQKDSKEYKLLVRAFILGEKFMDSHFKDAVVDSIIHKLRQTSFFDPRLTNLVYDNTPAQSPLRRLWQDVYVWSGNPGWLDENTLGEFVHAEFALDLSRYQMKLNRGQGPSSAPYVGVTCVYHEHADGVCYRFSGR